MDIQKGLKAIDLQAPIQRMWNLSGKKIKHLDEDYDESQGSPVFTVQGKYTSRGWTDWTQGFQYGSALLQFEASGDPYFLETGKEKTLAKMPLHVGHFGVHDHGFNNVSTYGNLLRLAHEGKMEADSWEMGMYRLALKLSGAIQARRWTDLGENGGYIYSFNGPHSLFVDTIRTCRALMLSHALGFEYIGEKDKRESLLARAVLHAKATAEYCVYYGEGRDSYDEWGRTAHESIFNTNDGNYRCPNAQQGFSGFTTWTRGLAWAMVGFPEMLEFLQTIEDGELVPLGGRDAVEKILYKAAKATCDFYIANTAKDGIPYWDTGAPGLSQLGSYLEREADPYNDHEPVDSSAAAIGAQGLLRLGKLLEEKEPEAAKTYWEAGLTVSKRLLEEPYLSSDVNHQGLLLHAIYHRPNGWDYVPEGSKIPYGESCMWGDYHLRELATFIGHMIEDRPYYTFFAGVVDTP